MTQPEKTGVRELNMSRWIRQNLPDSSLGFMATDVDWFLYNYITKRVMILEIKTRNSKLKTWQKNFYDMLSRWIKSGIDEGWSFLGFHIVRFENTFFNDGKCFYDSIEVTEETLRHILSQI